MKKNKKGDFNIDGFIIGGSPSTGSSLLRQILNRHSMIVCAHETHIWSKPKIVEAWSVNKFKLTGLKFLQSKDKGLFPFRGINHQEIPAYNSALFQKLANDSSDLISFFKSFMKTFYNLKTDQFFGEKTPANALNFKSIIENCPSLLCIHTVRNPYDVIASLIERGKSVPEAIGFYLLNCSSALNELDSDRMINIQYEKLVDNPEWEIKIILEFLGLNFEEQMLEARKSHPNEITKIESWKYDESENIGNKSIGRFQELPIEIQNDVKVQASKIRLKNASKFISIEEICTFLAYDFLMPSQEVGQGEKKYYLNILKQRRFSKYFVH